MNERDRSLAAIASGGPGMPLVAGHVSRRQFGTVLAAWSGWSAATTTLAADDAVPQKDPDPGEAVKEAEATLPPIEIEDLLLAALVQRYPSPHLTPERLSGIRAGLQRNRVQADLLRRVPLANGDAPATIFRVLRT